LAVVAWSSRTAGTVQDCRAPFDNLVELTRRRASGCCTVVVRPEDVGGGSGLQALLDRLRPENGATLCLMPGIYLLREPLRLNRRHASLSVEGCHDGAILRVAEGAEARFLDGMIVLNRVDGVTLARLQLDMPLVPLAEAR